MKLTIQTFIEGKWRDAALVTLEAPEKGYKSPSGTSYEVDYFAKFGAIPYSEDRPLRGVHAYSVDAPVDLADRSAKTWPAFLLDFIPQGRHAERIARFLELPVDAPSTRIHLLMRAGSSPVGNVRIKEAYDQEAERLEGISLGGVTMKDILDRSDAFLEVADRFSMLASGSSGLQGDWPKVSLTRSRDGLWYPNSMVQDGDGVDYIIAKLLRSDEGIDQRILESEAGYSEVAKEFGIAVERTNTYGSGVLVIPRFDRKVTADGLLRYGQESLVSAIGVAEFAYQSRHEIYLKKIQAVSSNPLEDTTEYLLRDMLNLAMGNPDNHGRNTALRKFPDGSIRLAPLFDFAPMKIAAAGIVRSTKWGCMLEGGGQDIDPDWREVCETVSGPNVPAEKLMAALAAKENLLRALPEIATKHGVPDSVVTNAIIRNEDMANGVAKLRNVPA
ncbi:type II toxin-antitoxin system HipA family toxin [Bradyrhizobium sp. Cp5.3]|uniref:type II toxin-antitoxin system HipA family toxin n=1 Tax=Bradyrhizobium sp. Cp5.3 TaxID=443598 RepID=UPI00040D6281|nr:HipA domain-containing protein [Bradyrhizobium sp. Cp5.3]